MQRTTGSCISGKLTPTALTTKGVGRGFGFRVSLESRGRRLFGEIRQTLRISWFIESSYGAFRGGLGGPSRELYGVRNHSLKDHGT